MLHILFPFETQQWHLYSLNPPEERCGGGTDIPGSCQGTHLAKALNKGA